MSDQLSIRATTKADLADVDALLARSYPALLAGSYPPSVLVTAIPLIAKANPRLVTSGTYFAVFHESEGLVGAGGWTGYHPNTGRTDAAATGHIRHVVTDHRLVRQGVGRALMGHIIDSARAAGITRMECFSTLMAVPFYAACGFDEVGPISVGLQPGIDFPAVMMQRSL